MKKVTIKEYIFPVIDIDLIFKSSVLLSIKEINDLAEKIKSALNEVPAQYQKDAKLQITADEESEKIELAVQYEREETGIEKNNRKIMTQMFECSKKESERKEYERLKAIYG